MASEDEKKLEMLEAALLLNNKDPLKWFWLGRQQRKMNRLADARKSYGRALALDAKFADGHYELGLLESAEGNETAAEAAFTQATQFNPKHFGAHDELARRREATANWVAALPHLLAMASGRPDDTPTLRRAAAACIAQGLYADAIAHLERAVEKAPTDAALRGDLGRCYVEQGAFAQARECFTAVPLEGLDESALLALAKAYRELGELADSARCYEGLLAKSPSQPEALLGLGRTRLSNREFELARAVLARAVELDGSRAELHGLHAQALQGLERFTQALDASTKGIALDPAAPLCHENAGLALNSLRRFDEAVSAFQRALRYDQTRLVASVGLAEAHEQLNQGERAVAALQSALQVAPSDANLHQRLGNLLYRLGHTSRALTSYRDAARLDPTMASAYRGIGQCAVDLESYTEATEALAQAIELVPEDVVALRLMGKAERALGRPTRAAENFERATRVDPKDALTWHQLGESLIEADKLSPALDALERARAIDPSEATERLVAAVLLRLSRFEDAVPVLEQLVKVAPDDAPLWRELGRAYRKLGQDERARDPLGRAARLRRTEAGYSLEHGLVCLSLNEYESGAQALELAHQLDPDDTTAAVALGRAYNGLGRFDDAVSVLSKTLGRTPTLLEGQRALGRALVALERLPEAKVCFEKAVALADDDGPAHHELGDVLLRLGVFADAVVHLKRASLLVPERTEAMRGLARAQRRLGSNQDALTSYRQLLRQLPEDVEALLELAETNEALGRDEEALGLLEQAHALRANPDTQRRIGLLQAKLGRDRLATETLDAVLGDDPSEFGAYAVLAACHRRLRNEEEELRALERAATLAEKAKSADAHSHYRKLGLALADTSREPPAIAALTRALELGDAEQETVTRLAALHRAAGTRALGSHDSETAARHLEQAMKNPTDAELYRLLASAYLELHRHDDAVQLLGKGLQAFPKDFELPSFLGQAELDVGNHAEAFDAFQKALALRPEAFHELWGAALSAEALGRRKEAIALLVRAQNERPDAPEVAEHLGNHYYEDGRFKDSLTAWQKLLELRPLDAEASYRKGLCERDLGDDTAAASSFERAATQAPNKALAHFEHGASLVRLGKLEPAVAALRVATEREPKHDDARELLGRCLAKLGHDSEAVDVLGACLRVRFEVELGLTRARCLARLERWLELEGAADAVLKATPGHTEALQLRAQALESQGRTDEALSALRTAVAEGKDRAAKDQLRKLLVERARASTATQNPQAAAPAYREALTLAPKDAELHLSLSLSLRAAGQVQPALDATRVGLEVDPNGVELWVLCAELLASGGVLDESLGAYQRALELSPEHAVALLGVATVFERRGEFENASQALLRASKLPEPRVALERRAPLLERLGQKEEQAHVLTRLHELAALDGEGLRKLTRLNTELGHHDAAAKSAQAALAVLVDDAECLYLLALAERAVDSNERALAPLERLTATHPDHPGAWALLARVLVGLQRWDRAVPALERALETEPNEVEFWQGLSTAFDRLGQRSDRAHALRRWLKLAPSPTLQRQLGVLLDELGAADADVELEAAVRELPEDDELARRLATLLLSRADQSAKADARESALSTVRRAVPHASRDGKLSFRAATALRELGRSDEALALADRALELDPSDVATLILHGELRLENGIPAGALVSFRRAVELKADALPALRGLGRASLALEQFADAENALRRATTISPDDVELWSLLTDALHGKGSKHEACDAQRQVVRLSLSRGSDADPLPVRSEFVRGPAPNPLRAPPGAPTPVGILPNPLSAPAGAPTPVGVVRSKSLLDEQFRLAKLCMNAERFAESVEVLTPLWKDEAAGADVGLAFAESLVEIDRMQEAVEVAERALASPTSDATAVRGALERVRATALSELDRADDAIAAYERALDLGQSEVREPLAEALRRRGAALAQSDARRSSELYDRALRLAPRDGSTLLALARSRRDSGELQAALDATREALALDPVLLAAQLLLAQLEAALGRHEPAIAAFERVLQADAESVEAWLGKGLSQCELRSPEAVASLEQSVRLRPTQKALDALLSLHQATGDEGQTLHALDRLARLGPLSSERASELGRLCIAHGRAREAQALLEDALAREEKHPELLLQKGRAALATGSADIAVEAFSMLLEVQPTHDAAHGLLGRAETARGQHALAVMAFQRQVEQTPTAECLEELADSLGRAGDEKRRSEVLARLSRARHDDEHGLLRIARTHAEAGRLDEAIGVLERALELAPGSGAIGNLLGRQLLAKATREHAARNVQPALLCLERTERLPADKENLPSTVALYVAFGELAAAARVANAWLEFEPRNPKAHTEAGRVQRLLRDEGRALAHFERALGLDGDHLPALRGAGLALLAANRPKEASEMLLRAVRLDATDEAVDGAAIDAAARNSDLEKAEAILRELCTRLPRSAAAQRELALVLGKRDNAAEALEHLEHALALAPADVQACIAKADLLLRLGRASEAREAAERAAQLSPGNSDAQRVLGLSRAQSGETQDAIEPLEMAYAENPSPNLAERLGHLYAAQGIERSTAGSHGTAVPSLRRALELGNREPGTRIALGQSLLCLGQAQGAIEVLRDELELNRDYLDGWLLLGEACSRSNQWSNAADAFDVALELEPQLVEALRGRARVAAQQKDNDRATQLFEQALELRPDQLELRREAVRWYEGLGETKAVLRHLERLGTPETLEDDELRRLGILLGKERRDIDAERVLEEALGRGLGDVATLDALSDVKARRDAKSAVEPARRLVELDPTHFEGWVRLARGMHAAGDDPAAARAYERAIQLKPSKELMAELATLQGASAHADGRIETLRRLVERYPDDAEHTATLGLELAKEGRPDAALVLERALGLGSTNADVRSTLFELTLARARRAAEAQRHKEALDLAQHASRLLPAHTAPGLLMATVHRAERGDDAAIDALRGVLAIDGQSCAALIQLGAIETERGEYQAAIPRLRRAAELDPKDTEALRVLADAEVGLQRPDAAIQALERLLERSPTDLPARRQLIRQLMTTARFPRALELCQQALRDAPTDVPVRLDLARAYHSLQRTDQAVHTVEEVLGSEPDNLVALRLRADLFRAVQDAVRLAAALQDLYRVDRSREHLLELEQCGQKLGKLELRLWALHELVALSASDATAVARLGEALHEKGHVNDAIRQLERAVALDGNTPWIRDALVRICWVTGRQKDAEHDLRSAAEYLEKAFTHASTNWTLAFEYASVLRRAKHARAGEAMRNALRAALTNPAKSGPVLLQIGAALFDMQDYAAAAQAYHQACQLQPQQVEHQRALISALLHGGQRAEAVEWLRHAVRLAPRDESLLYSLGVQYALLGRMNEVRDVWNALHPLNPQLAQQLLAQSQARR